LHLAEQRRGVSEGIGMVEGVQQAGEIVVIPAGWWHVVVNLEPTVAYTENFVTRSNIGAALFEMMADGDLSKAAQWFHNLPLTWKACAVLGSARQVCCSPTLLFGSFVRHFTSM